MSIFIGELVDASWSQASRSHLMSVFHALSSSRRKINQRAAQASLVLLQNPGGDRAVLPLDAQRSHIAVVGPHANATHALIEVCFRVDCMLNVYEK